MFLLVLLLKSPGFSNPDHILKSLYWLKVQLFSPHISSSSLLLHVIYTTSYQYSLLDSLDHPHWSLFSNHQLTPVSRSQNHSLQYASPHLWNKLAHSLRVYNQPNASSSPNSSPSSCSDSLRVVDISLGVFTPFKVLVFSKSFHP